MAVYPGVDDLDLFGPVRVLRAAGRDGAQFDVRIVTRETADTVTTSSGVRLEPDGRYQPGADLLLVPGGGWGARAALGAWGEVERGDWLPLLRQARDTTPVFAGVCTGSMLLAHAGVLTGRRANTHHAAHPDLAELEVQLTTDRVVDDGDVLTSGGVTSGIDLALWIVERFAGRERADRVAAGMEYDRFRPV